MTTTKALCEKTLDFLEDQRLPPTPPNYALGFAYVSHASPELHRAVMAIADGGVRITQPEADALHARFIAPPERPAPPPANPGTDALRHQTLRLADLAADAQAVTGEFSRELAFRLDDFASADIETLQALLIATLDRSQRSESELAATTAQVEQLRVKLEAAQDDAERDALTGLPNRRGIETHLAHACALRDTHMVAICDIDRFKSYNDRYGHAVGDRLLRTVANSLAQSLAGHFVGRWGGEEFLMVLRADLATGKRMIEDAQLALGNRHFRLRETDEPMGRVTFSAGITALPPDPRAVEEAIERADALLYRAKDEGRDRVIAG
ncbi:MAG: GGDEF domain-containing protein [Sphingomonas bacterium]